MMKLVSPFFFIFTHFPDFNGYEGRERESIKMVFSIAAIVGHLSWLKFDDALSRLPPPPLQTFRNVLKNLLFWITLFGFEILSNDQNLTLKHWIWKEAEYMGLVFNVKIFNVDTRFGHGCYCRNGNRRLMSTGFASIASYCMNSTNTNLKIQILQHYLLMFGSITNI